MSIYSVVPEKVLNEVIEDIKNTLTHESYGDYVYFKRNKDDVLRVKHQDTDTDEEYIVLITLTKGAH